MQELWAFLFTGFGGFFALISVAVVFGSRRAGVVEQEDRLNFQPWTVGGSNFRPAFGRLESEQARRRRCDAGPRAEKQPMHVVTAVNGSRSLSSQQRGHAYDDPSRPARDHIVMRRRFAYSRGSRRRTRKITDPIAAPIRKDGIHRYHSKTMRPHAEPSRETAAGGVTWNSSRTNTATSMTPAPRRLPRFGPRARAATRPIKAGTTSTTSVR